MLTTVLNIKQVGKYVALCKEQNEIIFFEQGKPVGKPLGYHRDVGNARCYACSKNAKVFGDRLFFVNTDCRLEVFDAATDKVEVLPPSDVADFFLESRGGLMDVPRIVHLNFQGVVSDGIDSVDLPKSSNLENMVWTNISRLRRNILVAGVQSKSPFLNHLFMIDRYSFRILDSQSIQDEVVDSGYENPILHALPLIHNKTEFVLCVRDINRLDLIGILRREIVVMSRLEMNDRSIGNIYGCSAFDDCWWIGGSDLKKIRLITKKD